MKNYFTDIRLLPVSKIRWVLFLCVIGIILSSCGKPYVRRAPGKRFYFYSNKIHIIDSSLSRMEKLQLSKKMMTQIDDSALVTVNKNILSMPVIRHPLPFDTTFVNQSVRNMQSSLFHMGYYSPSIKIKTDTSGFRIYTSYTVNPGTYTQIRMVDYDFKLSDLSRFEKLFSKASLLKPGKPITKLDVLTEINRLTDSFRNHGYYRFNAANLRTFGDTSRVSQAKAIPGINLKISLSATSDSQSLRCFSIDSIHLIPDWQNGEDMISRKQVYQSNGLTIRENRKLFNPIIYPKWVTVHSGEIFKQEALNQTIYQFNRSGVWRTVNVKVEQRSASDSLVNIYFLLTPANKFNIETSAELSYAASANAGNILGGNLFGISGNLGITNRNLFQRGIRMSHNFRAGIELNNNTGGSSKFINSNELSYQNSVSIQRLVFPSIPQMLNRKNRNLKGDTYINLGTNFITRFNLFKLQTTQLGFGWSGVNPSDWRWSWSFFNLGYSNVYNRSDSFNTILDRNPFLRFSYNTALVNGMSINFSKINIRDHHPNSLQKEESFRFNAEESGLTWGALPLLDKYKRRFLKMDGEAKQSMQYNKSSLVLRAFVGLGIPLLGSDSNRTLPFFKQYFGGGSNSMRAWPIRGIGPGGRPLIPYSSNQTAFNDRTGDIQIEMNAEYRYNILQIIPNTLTLKGAVFTDIGNIWNMRNTNPTGQYDSTQFVLRNLYSQLGVAAGTGLRLDFNYFVVRLDFGFRLKRPELYKENNGWKLPNVSWDDVWQKIFTRGKDDEYRKWRYENFNFSIGIGYAF